jgi:hypothetical protein
MAAAKIVLYFFLLSKKDVWWEKYWAEIVYGLSFNEKWDLYSFRIPFSKYDI